MNLSILNAFFQKGEKQLSSDFFESAPSLDSFTKTEKGSFADLFSQKIEESAVELSFYAYPQESSAVSFTQKEIESVRETEESSTLPDLHSFEAEEKKTLIEEKPSEKSVFQAKKETKEVESNSAVLSVLSLSPDQKEKMVALLKKGEKESLSIPKKAIKERVPKGNDLPAKQNQMISIQEKNPIAIEKEKNHKLEKKSSFEEVLLKEGKEEHFENQKFVDKSVSKQTMKAVGVVSEREGLQDKASLLHKVKVVKVHDRAKEFQPSQQANALIEKNIMADLVKEGSLKIDSPLAEFQSKVVRYLQNSGMDRIVNQAKLILKEGNRGEINLMLRPQQLGNVKIHLNLEENRIVGKILVENQAVREAFKEIAADLSKALMDNGFESASLDISLFQSRQEYQMGEKENFFDRKRTLTNHWEKASDISNETSRSSYYSINQESSLDLIV